MSEVETMKTILTIAFMASYLLTYGVTIAEPAPYQEAVPTGIEMSYKEYASTLVPNDQREAFFELIRRESGWNPTAQNPHSTAYGIGQFLNSTWETVGCEKTSNAQTQLDCMVKYIEKNFGTPINALLFHDKNNWY